MRTVAVLIGTLDAIPCDIRASVNASNLIVRQESRLVLLLKLLEGENIEVKRWA